MSYSYDRTAAVSTRVKVTSALTKAATANMRAFSKASGTLHDLRKAERSVGMQWGSMGQPRPIDKSIQDFRVALHKADQLSSELGKLTDELFDLAKAIETEAKKIG